MTTVEAPTHATHSVVNQPPPLEGINTFEADLPLREALEREGGGWGADRARDLGAVCGSAEAHEHARRAQRNEPRLVTHDRYGHRVDRVDYDPSWDWLLGLGIEREIPSLPWRNPVPGAHVVRAALFQLLGGVEAGVMCPISMTYSAVPALRADPSLAAEWEPRLTLPDPARGALAGMAMTEKQGGSDVRANTTRAEPPGSDGEYELTGHKWFCSHPICDVFLVLAQAPEGLSCFLVERGQGFEIQRLKDKLGTRSLASSEVEFRGARGRLLGPEGRGVPTIIEMVAHTRLDCILGTSAGMRRAVAEAVHHARHRSAFGAPLIEQPAMRNVLADLALESEAATATALRVARSYDEGEDSTAFRRFATAVMKYWVCKRGAPVAVEALECLGGNGYVEESPMPAIYRDIQINSTWEGSGNVMALDVLRAMAKDPEAASAFVAECELAAGGNALLDHHLAALRRDLAELTAPGVEPQWGARRLVERLGLGFQASLLVRSAPPAVSDAFCAARLGEERGRAFGTLPHGVDERAVLERALTV